MAQIVKNNNKTKYDDVDKVLDSNKSKKAAGKPKKQSNNKQTKKETEKKGLWERFMIYCHGIKEEWKKIHWTKKENLVKYSIAVIVFVILLGIFFYIIGAVFARIVTLLG